MTRMQHREFGMASAEALEGTFRSDQEYDHIAIATEVESVLLAQLKSPARVRGGLLFGYHESGVLYILMASTAGISNWYPTDPHAGIDVDPRFGLGWSQALATLFGTKIHWVGNWIIHPDGRLKGVRRDIRRFKKAFATGVVTHQDVLMVIGRWENVVLRRAYRTGID